MVQELDPGHTAGPGLSLQGLCLGPGRRMWQSPSHCPQHVALGGGDPCGEKAWLTSGSGWWQGRVGGQGTLLRADGQHHQAPFHSQEAGRLLTLLSSVDVANMTGTGPITSWTAQWQPGQHLRMTHKSTRQGVDQDQGAKSGGADSKDWGERQPV